MKLYPVICSCFKGLNQKQYEHCGEVCDLTRVVISANPLSFTCCCMWGASTQDGGLLQMSLLWPDRGSLPSSDNQISLLQGTSSANIRIIHRKINCNKRTKDLIQAHPTPWVFYHRELLGEYIIQIVQEQGDCERMGERTLSRNSK